MAKLSSESDLTYAQEVERHFVDSSGTHSQKMQSFPRFISRQTQAIYLFKWEMYKKILNLQGSICEFGVYMGAGIFSFASFCTMLEPFNYQRRIIGFDTFTGFPDISASDTASAETSDMLKKSGFAVSDSLQDELQDGIRVFDMNRPISHIPKISLVRGDVLKTLPVFLEKNPHTLISLLYLDLDLYEPTKFVLEQLYDRVVPGGVVAFDEINNPEWPGETRAYLEFFQNRKHGRMEKCSFEPLRSYFIKE